MAGLVYLGMAKKLPFGTIGGAAAAFAVWQLFPATAAAAASGAPTAADISTLTTGAGDIVPPEFSPPMPTVNFPAGSIAGYGGR
jgi:hypothetical protein